MFCIILRFHRHPGSVVAVYGREGSSGAFEVEDLCYAGLPPQDPAPALSPSTEPTFIAFVSGLNLGGEGEHKATSNLQLEMLVDVLTGQLGDGKDAYLASRIARVVFCGNGLSRFPETSAVPSLQVLTVNSLSVM